MSFDRRRFLAACGSVGAISPLLPGILCALSAQAAAAQEAAGEIPPAWPKITPDLIDQAARMAGVGPFTAAQKQMMLEALDGRRDSYAPIRALKMANSVPPAFVFHPAAALKPPAVGTTELSCTQEKDAPQSASSGDSSAAKPISSAHMEDLAFAGLAELGNLLKNRAITSTALTRMFLGRLRRYDSSLHFLITLTEERALRQAAAADEEIAAGNYRGPLHGIPWGAKDLLAVQGYPTTWGAAGFEHQSFDEDATVVKRLDEAGAVLVAKFALGALAMGDQWFGGRTRNPWNPRQGSSGSSAGSASAVAAGCVAFALGSETLGSISSPCTRCGVTGLRPSFGLVPRTGAMALSWTMDKLGPIARSAEDCATILEAIQGPDGQDTSVASPKPDCLWDGNWKQLRVGYVKSEFDPLPPLKPAEPAAGESAEAKQLREEKNAVALAARARRDYDRRFEQAALDRLQYMGVKLVPVELPRLPYEAIANVLTAEAAAAFDDLTMSGRDRLLTGQSAEDWPNVFRAARFYPAVEYIQAGRARTLAVQQFAALFRKVDILVTPSTETQLTATNLTGTPALIVPNGLRGDDAPPPPEMDDGNHDDIGGPGTPVSLTFLAGLHQEARLTDFVAVYQQATGFHKLHPRLDRL